jgi:hypothetical protein
MERGREAQKHLKTAKYNASPWRPAARRFRGGGPSCTVRAPRAAAEFRNMTFHAARPTLADPLPAVKG